MVFEEFVNLWSPESSFSWQALTIIAISISFSLSAIAYMLSKLFDSEAIFRWAKTEFMYALSTVFVLLLVFTTFTAIGKMMYDFSLQVAEGQPMLLEKLQASQQDPLILTKVYLDRIGTCARKEFVWLACISFIPMASANMEIGATNSMEKSDTGVLLSSTESVILNTIHAASYQMSYVMYSLYLQKHLLLFIQQTMLVVFLPLGIILRTFPFTRGAGNMFIAIAIGFYVVYPTAYSMILAISLPYKTIDTTCGLTGVEDSFTDYKQCFGGLAEGTIYGLVNPSILGKAAGAVPSLLGTTVGTSFLRMTGPTVMEYASATARIGGFLGVVYMEVKDVFSSLLIYVFLYPMAVIGITLTFVKFFADFLGAGVEDFANGLLRVV